MKKIIKTQKLKIRTLHGEKIFAVYANRIVNIEATNFFHFPSNILVVSTKNFFEPTKESVMLFWLLEFSQQTLLLVQQKFDDTTKILLGQQKKFVGSISTILFANAANLISPSR